MVEAPPSVKSVRVTQSIRPTRVAFLVPDVPEKITEVTRWNTALWGGVFNPIVVYDQQASHKHTSLLTLFDPDLIWIDESIPNSAVPDKVKRRWPLSHRELITEDVPGEKRMSLCDIARIQELYDRRTEHWRHDLVLAKCAKGAEFYEQTLFMFGEYPEGLFANLEEGFRKLSGFQTTVTTETPSKHNWATWLSPIEFTRAELEVHRYGHGHRSSALVFIGDHKNMRDLIDYWNLRALGYLVLFIPERHAEECKDQVEGWCRRYSYTERFSGDRGEIVIPELWKGTGVQRDRFQAIAGWITELVKGGRAFQVDLDGLSWVQQNLATVAYHESHHSEMSYLIDGQVELMTKAPRFVMGDSPYQRQLWAIDLGFSATFSDERTCFDLPAVRGVETELKKKISVHYDDIALKRTGITFMEDDWGGSLYFRPLEAWEVVRGAFADAGMVVTPSSPGRFAERIMAALGGRIESCRCLKIAGVREILSKLNRQNMSLSRQALAYMLDRAWEAHNAELYLYPDQPYPLTRDIVLDFLVDRSVLRPGLRLKCDRCTKKEWHPVGAFSERFTCPYCGSIESLGSPEKHVWRYRLNGMFSVPGLGQGSVPVILSLWRLTHTAPYKSIYSTNVHVTDATTNSHLGEIDFVFLRPEQAVTLPGEHRSWIAVIGEAKGWEELSQSDLDHLAAIAKRLEGCYIVCSTTRGAFSETEKDMLRNLVNAHERTILFTKHELDPYELHKRFPGARYLDDLGELARLTQGAALA